MRKMIVYSLYIHNLVIHPQLEKQFHAYLAMFVDAHKVWIMVLLYGTKHAVYCREHVQAFFCIMWTMGGLLCCKRWNKVAIEDQMQPNN